MTNNLALWQSVQKTPAEHTKVITGKSYNGTSPKPHYLVLKATETFGPCGIGWGFNILDERIEDGAGGERLSIARVKVWYVWNGQRGEVEHIGGTQFSGTRSSGKPFTDEDAPKKSVTDALVKALSMIGFAGDIFLGRYDDSKYVQELREEAREAARASTAKPSAPAAPKQSGDAVTSKGAPPSPLSGSLPDELQGADLSEMELACALEVPGAILRHKDRHDFVKWWNGFKDTAREILPPEYYADVLVPVIKNHAATLPAASDKKDAG